MHFVITFGFLISTKFDVNIGNANIVAFNKKVTKKQQHKKEVKVKNNHNNAEIKSNKHNNTETKPNIINIGKILTEVHVEYELLPGYTFKFDCRCWETATKIYTENGDWCLRPIVHENNRWVVFSVCHDVDLNEVQLQKFCNYVITYQIFSGKNKFCERFVVINKLAKKDKVKQFYTHDNKINFEHNDFLEIYPSESESITKSRPEPIIVKHETDGEFSIISYLDVIPDSRHQYKFWKMMKKEKFPSEPVTIEFVPFNEVKVPLKSKKLKTMKTQEMSVQKLSLTARNLFSDIGAITCYTRKSQIPNMLSVFIYTQCENILPNNKLRNKFNNISIKLEKISNIPNNIVIQKGFNYLYVKINFIDKTIITPYYTPTKTIYFDFMNCFMNNEFQAEELISFLGTKPLTFQVLGVRNKNTAKPAIYTQKMQSKEMFILEQEEVLLGFASFDISDLLRGLGEIRLSGNMFQPENMHCINVNNNSDETSPFTHNILPLSDTIMKIKVRLAHDLAMIHHVVLEKVHTLNRIFLILDDYQLADSILSSVFSHNCKLFSKIHSPNEDTVLTVDETSKNILTGFAIDSCGKYYIFLEGLAKGYLLKVWEKLAKIEIKRNCIFYNSSAIFLTRLYEDFMFIGGFLLLKLSEPLEIQLQQHGLYVGQTKTTHRACVMRTIRLMELTTTMISLSQKCLFPKADAAIAILEDISNHCL